MKKILYIKNIRKTVVLVTILTVLGIVGSILYGYRSYFFRNSPEGVVINFGLALGDGDIKKAKSYCTGRGKVNTYLFSGIYVIEDKIGAKKFEDMEFLSLKESWRKGDIAAVDIKTREKGQIKVKVIRTKKVNGKWLIDGLVK